MSRTHKDLPKRLYELNEMRKGKIKHNHKNLGKTRKHGLPKSVLVPKKDTRTLKAYRNYFIENEISFSEEEYVESDHYFLWYGEYPEFKTQKQIRFTYSEIYRIVEYSSYCTDAENYDSVSKTDKRDGKIAVCKPDAKHIGVCQHCGSRKCGDRFDLTKSHRRAKFSKIAKAYNNGSSVEELEEMNESYSSKIENEYQPSSWAQYC